MFWSRKKVEEKKNDEGAQEVPQLMRTWLDGIMAQLQPERLKIQPGETLGRAVHRIFDQEEQRLRASQEQAELRDLKLRALAELRDNFPLQGQPKPAAAPAVQAGEGQGGEADGRPREATFELAMAGIRESPMSNLADLIELWVRVVEGVGQQAGISETLRQEYCRVQVSITGTGDDRELVAWFRGGRDMVTAFRGYLREMGLETP